MDGSSHWQDQEEESEEKEHTDREPKYIRKYFWTHYVDSGFPNTVNHAVCGLRDTRGDYYAYSMGGYHADNDESTVLHANTLGRGPFFKSSPIDVHCLDYETKTWSQCDPRAPSEKKYVNTESYARGRVPVSRYAHTVCHYKGKVYLYGGRNDEDGSFSKTDCYDCTLNIWLKLHTSGDGPSPRHGHACTLLGNEMVVHGGFASQERKFSGDMYAFNLDHHSWRKFLNRGERVPEREVHVATAVRNKVVVFGGHTGNFIYPNEFYFYELESSQWYIAPKKGPYQPDGRRSLSAIAIGDNVFYFGGYNATKKCHYGDLFLLNTVSWQCMEIRPFGDAPSPRRRVGCALIGSNLMICGGTSPVEVERDGKKREIMHIHSDMYTLHLIPSLEQLCITVLVKSSVNLTLLPLHLQHRIANLLSLP